MVPFVILSYAQWTGRSNDASLPHRLVRSPCALPLLPAWDVDTPLSPLIWIGLTCDHHPKLGHWHCVPWPSIHLSLIRKPPEKGRRGRFERARPPLWQAGAAAEAGVRSPRDVDTGGGPSSGVAGVGFGSGQECRHPGSIHGTIAPLASCPTHKQLHIEAFDGQQVRAPWTSDSEGGRTVNVAAPPVRKHWPRRMACPWCCTSTTTTEEDAGHVQIRWTAGRARGWPNT